MPILKIQDTEAINVDSFKDTLFPVPGARGSAFVPFQERTKIVESEVTYISADLIPVLNQEIKIRVSPSFTFDQLNDLAVDNTGVSVLTHKTSLNTPDEDIDENTFNYNNYATDAFSYYNIRNEDYEDYTEANDERLLPNFCLGALWTRPGNNSNQEQVNYYTMFGEISSLRFTDILGGSTPINNYEFDDEFIAYGTHPNTDYEIGVDYYKHILFRDQNGVTPRPQYRDANTHVYVDFDYNLNDSEQIGNTPFYNRIRLPVVDRKVPIELPNGSEYFLETNDNFPSDIVRSFSDSSMSEKLIKSFRQSNSFMRNFTINGDQTELKVYDLIELYENISYRTSIRESDEMFLRDVNTNYVIDTSSPFTFYFYKLLLLGKIRNTIKNNLLDFEQLVVDKEDHRSEHVGFKVIKKIQGRNTPIQTFYFLNRRGLEDFIDSQIKFDRVYEYQVIGMFAIYGSNYSYENISAGERPINEDGSLQEGSFLDITFVNRPSVKIVEVTLSNHILRVVEPPPIVPEITFYNEMTSRNKLKIRMEHQDGNIVDEYMKKPLRPFGNNQGYIDKLEQYFSSPNVLVTSGKTSDGVYEVYRLEEPPKSYKDFEDALIATVQSNTVYSNGESSRNAMFVDMIKHQKKYYYAFRVLTHRGNPSELSPIYVAEMYEDADETFLTFDLYQEPEIKDSQNIYNMRKYIQIIPNFEQTVPNEQFLLDNHTSAEDAIEDVSLGNEQLQEQLWEYKNKDKYIKLRLESKSSGRKMDINLYFKIKKPTN